VISLLYNYYPGEVGEEMPGLEMPDVEMPDLGMPDVEMPDAFNEMPDARRGDARREAVEKMPDARRGDARHSDTRREAVEEKNSIHHPPLTTHNSPLTTDNSQLTTDNSHLTLHLSPLTPDSSPFKLSRYAYGEDYHKVVRRKLKALVAEMKREIGEFNARVFVDSAPVMERDWAKRSGQGWIGKNTLLIHPKKGSYFFLAEIILDVELEYDHPMRDHCGTCTRCIDACPTDAISPEGYILDGSKCISYLTIELKSQIPESFKGQMEEWIYGCDICQEVCPWNRFSKPHQEPAFEMTNALKEMKKDDWLELTEDVFENLFSKSAVKRAGYEGLKRSISFCK
jgi:epoxyqueuosine reductase